MHHAVVHLKGSVVHLPAQESTTSTTVAPSTNPGPIIPELKELAWGGGSFIVFALLMRVTLYPKLKKGMQARYEGIRSAHANADAERARARAEVADYETQLVAIRAEAARTVEAARATVESERSAAVAQLNARLADQRAAAAAQVDAARSAARSQIRDAVSDVAGRAGELATGKRPSPDVVNRVVDEVMAK